MIAKLIAKTARRQFARAMNFEETNHLVLPQAKRACSRLLYIHIPFCESLCSYCSFHRVLFQESICRAYFKALRNEIRLYRQRGYDFSGVYVGGGTPTVLMDELEETLSVVRENFEIREISVETNPNHLIKEKLAILSGVGINRLSVGIQSFDDTLLKAMGRYETYGSGKEILARVENARGCFHTLNADMIFNFPLQTSESLNRDIDILLDAGVDQITYYPLMVSDATREVVARTFGAIDYRKEEKFYSLISQRLSSFYQFSSAWCFSKSTSMVDEYIIDYDEYAGLGSGSIGFLGGKCYANTFNISDYIARLANDEIPLMAMRTFNVGDQIRYDFLMKLFGMRLVTHSLREKYGMNAMRYWLSDAFLFGLIGAIRYRKGTISLTEKGRYWWVVMMREFFTAVNNFRDFCLNRR